MDSQAPLRMDNCDSPNTPSYNHNGARYQGPCLGTGVVNCLAVFLSYFSLRICFEIKLKNKDQNERFKSAKLGNLLNGWRLQNT